jgi:transcription termination factor NusB
MLPSVKKRQQSPESNKYKSEKFRIISDEIEPLIACFFSDEERKWFVDNGVLDQRYSLRYQPRSVVANSADEAADIIKNDFLFEKFMLIMLDGLPGSGKGYLGESIKKMSRYEEGSPDKNFEGDACLYTQVLAESPENLCGLLDMVHVQSRFKNGVPYPLDVLQKKVFEHRNKIFPQNKETFLRYYINYPSFKSFVGSSINFFYKSGETKMSQVVPQYVRDKKKGNYLGFAPQQVNFGVHPQKIIRTDGVNTVNAFYDFWPEHTVNVVNFMPILENLINVVARDGWQKERPEFRIKELKHLFSNLLIALSRADIIHYDQKFKGIIQNNAEKKSHAMKRALEILKIAVAEIIETQKNETVGLVNAAIGVSKAMAA